MNRLMVVGAVVSLMLVSGLVGWQQAGTESYTMNSNQAQWKKPLKLEDGKTKVSALRQRLLGSPYFQGRGTAQNGGNGLSDEEGKVDSAIAAAEKEYGPFPHIISISRIDGLDTAQLRQADNMILTVHAGDTLPSGWVIARIFPDRLEADAGPTRFSFAVFEHMSMQEQDNAEE
ncbi:MAG: hypothetical protein Q9M33_07450 [Robiginitomaculum sp.]|nr:hypothetical protein [Robiginitomaculum sp.]MDQ7077618.1 hypothetical protein [Robiginitomaculum sp.]